ncbi:MAG TPA: 3-carboxy-cis,cis-muconate cycloisomerase [Candidatus Aquilonibacter sp.]|jgi:3-carboxy-cis,cis-muconate cycloisomerase|nr:3-carboxy-cis,cis-muconate cycloisomerase [Candidatus Aquilonibacter sp.]
MPVRLVDSLASTEALAEVFSDQSILQVMLDFEVALARAEARAGVIPQVAAEAIAAAANPTAFDLAAFSRDTLRAGTYGVPLAKMLTEIVKAKDSSAVSFVHYGATSQDVSDTALVLLLKRSQPLIEADLVLAEQALRNLSEEHARTTMVGRTLMQSAPPVTMGLKAAGWLAAIRRGRKQFSEAFAQALVVQFGGAVGTLAALGEKGLTVNRELASELGLACPDAPWHAHRDRLAALVCACGVLTGSLGKIARDVSLLMQSEIGEVAEPESEGRGGSSTMPQKRNPTGCAVTLAAANRVPGLVASFLSGMVQENERGVGGWHAEWPTIAAVMQATGVAAASIAEIAQGIHIDSVRMKENLAATCGAIYAEKALFLLSAKVGKDRARKLVEQATCDAVANHRHLKDVLREMPEVTGHLDPEAIDQLEVAEEYLGSADTFRDKQLKAAVPVRKED